MQLHDITGRTIKVGDILSVGQRSGNSGCLDIRVVCGFKESVDKWTKKTYTRIKTTAGGYLQIPEKTLIVPLDCFIGTEMEKEIKNELLKCVQVEI